MSNRIFIVAFFCAATLLLLAIDDALPGEDIETYVHPMTFNGSGGKLIFIAPGTGGEWDSCAVDDDTLRSLRPDAEIVIKKTALLGRCSAIKPVAADELACRQQTFAALFRDAGNYEQQKKFLKAHALYAALCDANALSGHKTDACASSLKLQQLIRKTRSYVLMDLAEHHRKTGNYPESLEPIVSGLPTALEEVARDFAYCKKNDRADRTARCTDGSISFADSEVSIVDAVPSGISGKTDWIIRECKNPQTHQG